jgi:hypothetical protein
MISAVVGVMKIEMVAEEFSANWLMTERAMHQRLGE